MKVIDFPLNSELRFANRSFAYSFLEKVKIPPQVRIVDDYAFSMCVKLSSLEFSDNSQLKKIGSCAFDSPALKSVVIPSSVTEIEEDPFFHLQIIEFEENSQLKNIEIKWFKKYSSNIIIMIPVNL